MTCERHSIYKLSYFKWLVFPSKWFNVHPTTISFHTTQSETYQWSFISDMTLKISFILTLALCIVHQSQAERMPQMWPMIESHGSGPTDHSGTVTAKSQYSSTYAGWNAFSANRQMWISGVYDSPTWIEYKFNQEREIWAYRFFFANGSLTSRAPKHFEFQVYSNGNWKTVDSRCCETDWHPVEERTFSMSTSVVGDRFRILFHDDNDSRNGVVVISLRRIQFLGSAV